MGNEVICLGIIKRKTALSAGDAPYLSECQLGPTIGIHVFYH